MNLSIAGIGFSVCAGDLPLTKDGHPETYASFGRDAAEGDCAAGVEVVVRTEGMPSVGPMRPIFEGMGAWSMFADAGGYYLVLNPSMKDGPECIARFDQAMRKVDAYCGKTEIVERGGERKVRSPLSYPLDQLLLMYALADRGGAIFHAAGIEMKGRAYLFAGRSGAGKSTISGQFADAGTAILLSDDRIALRKTVKGIMAYGTPWPGEAGIAVNRGALLSGLFFLEQQDEDAVREIGPGDAFGRLMPVTSVPWYDSETMTKVLSFCEELVSSVPAYTLAFRRGPGVVKVFEAFIERWKIA